MNGFKITWRNINMLVDLATWKPSPKTLQAIPAGKIVAESTFGCWVNLLDKGGTRGDGPYRKNVDYDSTLWRQALRKALPNSGGKRTTVFTTASHVPSLRNRAAHHEPLIDGVPLRSLPGPHPPARSGRRPRRGPAPGRVHRQERRRLAWADSRVPELLRARPCPV
ncbi:hypothetical protein [Streptomyces lavendofoliae]|uniref:Uncharacterized protein n=1 Tax=Streptomyces lavendofoliae TaxID=67314 RepID=A0A918I309_9ACTN|nr:hypothetical protein [Streptomyces lavendofoliae]GGU61152.1 hypothetical protein GCM10010274_57470 [Streptomyces lavendofoliae]